MTKLEKFTVLLKLNGFREKEIENILYCVKKFCRLDTLSFCCFDSYLFSGSFIYCNLCKVIKDKN